MRQNIRLFGLPPDYFQLSGFLTEKTLFMKIRLKTLMAGPEGVFPPGSVIEDSAEEAEMLIAGGFAEPLDAAPVMPEVETAAIEPGGREVKPPARARKTP